MSTARIGVETERALRKRLEADGYQVVRSAASKGPWDLIAIGQSEIRLIQLKRVDDMSPKRQDRELRFVENTNPKNNTVSVSKELHWKIKGGDWGLRVAHSWAVEAK